MSKKILIFTTRYGHLSLAQAANEAYKKDGWETKLVNQELKNLQTSYNLIYLFFPKAWKYFYPIFNARRLQGILKKLNKVVVPAQIVKEIEEFKPSLVLSTHCVFNQVLEKNKNKYNYKLLSIVVDPRTIFSYYFSTDVDLHFVYDQKLKNELNLGGVDKKKIIITGWLTRKSFYQKSEKIEKAKKPISILIVAGSVGTNSLFKFLPIFKEFEKDLKLTIVAGSSKLFYQTLNSYRCVNKMNYKLYGFTNNLPGLMNKADLVAGKAGPNSLFEAVAMNKPFLVLTHLRGQESGNLEIIKEKNLGWITEKPKQLRVVLGQILNNPELINEKARSVLKEKAGNIQAADKIVKASEQIL
ncbi:hypothetical protein ISS42_00650 [Candidatus Shapirobacteria bacterium]|nr:hypothetical protein [Candidatus Shapirobacteria bacterium]